MAPTQPREAELPTLAEIPTAEAFPAAAKLAQLGAEQIGKDDRIGQEDRGKEHAPPSHIEHVRLHHRGTDRPARVKHKAAALDVLPQSPMTAALSPIRATEVSCFGRASSAGYFLLARPAPLDVGSACIPARFPALGLS